MNRNEIRRAETLAIFWRSKLKLGAGPILDVREVLERQGILVYETPIPGGTLSGCFADVGDDLWVMVNSLDTVGRQRFTLAHEFCHTVEHRDLGMVLCTREKPPHEQFADVFAASFMMPEDSTRAFFSDTLLRGNRITPEGVIEYCYAFGVSCDSAVLRLHNIRLIAAQQRDALRTTAPRRLAAALGYDVQSPDSPFFAPDPTCPPAAESLPHAYRSAAIRAYDEERISERKFAELLRVDIEDLDDVLEPEEPEEVPVV